jgi:hypothetical protein
MGWTSLYRTLSSRFCKFSHPKELQASSKTRRSPLGRGLGLALAGGGKGGLNAAFRLRHPTDPQVGMV